MKRAGGDELNAPSTANVLTPSANIRFQSCYGLTKCHLASRFAKELTKWRSRVVTYYLRRSRRKHRYTRKAMKRPSRTTSPEIAKLIRHLEQELAMASEENTPSPVATEREPSLA